MILICYKDPISWKELGFLKYILIYITYTIISYADSLLVCSRLSETVMQFVSSSFFLMIFNQNYVVFIHK